MLVLSAVVYYEFWLILRQVITFVLPLELELASLAGVTAYHTSPAFPAQSGWPTNS